MREIKFRAWDESKKIMHFDVEFIRSGTEGNDWIIFKSDKQTLQDNKVLDNPYFQQQIKLMQYTGLKDKNGVEIYEGDLVKFFGIDNPCVIEFQDGGFGYNCRQRYSEFTSISGHNYLDELLETVEVIGNIYENSDLICNIS